MGNDVCVLIDRKRPVRREAKCEDTDLSDWLRTESVGAGFCKHVNESSGSLKTEFLGQINNSLSKKIVPWNLLFFYLHGLQC
jgi:hypothetical protein